MDSAKGHHGEPAGEAPSAELQEGLRRLYGSGREGPAGSRQFARMDPAAVERVRAGLEGEWARVMEAGGRRGAERRRVWVRAAAVGGGIAAAAAVALVVAIGLPGGGGGFGRVQGPVAASRDGRSNVGSADGTAARGGWDIDGSGGVDMVDAFVLARAIADEEARGGGSGVSGLWDVTGDGVVDGGDVDAVAMRAVRLDGGDGDAGAGGAG